MEDIIFQKDEQFIKQIAKTHLRGNLSVQFIVGKGSVNQVALVSNDHQSLIVRINTENQFQRFEKEKWCEISSRKNGIRTPIVLKVGKQEDAAFMFEEYVVGVNGEDSNFDVKHIWNQIGGFARSIHQIATVGLGDELIEGVFSGSWDKYLSYNISSLTVDDKLIQLGVLSWEESKIVKIIFEELASKKFTFGLCHGDLSLKNIIVDKDGKVTLLDWGSSESHIVPHFEIIAIQQNQVAMNNVEFQSFLDGYGLQRTDFEMMYEDIERIKLLIFFDKTRWAIDRNPSSIQEFAQRAKKMLQQILKLDNQR